MRFFDAHTSNDRHEANINTRHAFDLMDYFLDVASLACPPNERSEIIFEAHTLLKLKPIIGEYIKE